MRIAGLRYYIAAISCATSFQFAAQIEAQLKPPPLKPAQPRPSIELQQTPGTCPSGYIVDGRFVPKSQFQAAAASPEKPAQTLPTKPVVPSAPSLPAKPTLPQKSISQLPQMKLPRITHLAWNVEGQVLEVHGTDFVEFYTPSPGGSSRYTTPRLLVNGAAAQSQLAKGFFILARSVLQSGCYQFVVQRSVPKPTGGSQFTEEPGPQSLPYQEFVYVPKRVVITSVRNIPIKILGELRKPLTYEIKTAGAEIGSLGPKTEIWAMAQPNQRFPDGSTSKVMTLDQVQVVDTHTILVTNELVQGETIHAIKFSDPRYGLIQSNIVPASFPQRPIIEQVIPTEAGYILQGPNLGSDLRSITVFENRETVPRENWSLQVIPGTNSNTTQIQVNNRRVTGQAAHRILNNDIYNPAAGGLSLPSVEAANLIDTPAAVPLQQRYSRVFDFTHPPIPMVTGIEMTNYGFDVVGTNLGGRHDNPKETELALVTPSTSLVISHGQPQFTAASFFRQVSNSRIAVNYASGCLRLPFQLNFPTTVQVTATFENKIPRRSPPVFSFTFPQTWAQYTPVITSVTRTADGLEIAGANLGQPNEVCQIDVEARATYGNIPAQVVSGSLSPNDFLSVTDKLLRLRMSPVPSGQTTIIVRRAGMFSQLFPVNLGP